MELPLSSSHTMLPLKDVINRFNFLRGKGMAHSYSWSAKRSYKKGYVWQDLSENDFIYPCNNGQNDEYILKGTQLFQVSSSSTFKDSSSESTSSTTGSNSPAGSTKKTTTRTIKMKEAWKLAAINASTQTDENLEKKNESDEQVVEDIMIINNNNNNNNGEAIATTLPVSGKIIEESSSSSLSNMREYCRMENENQSGRMKASTVLMQLMRCVSSKKLM